MHPIKSICVFCGSSQGNNADFSNQARKLGLEIAKQGLTLIYGGGNIGLMGVLADEVLKENGKVHGIIPHFLSEKEVGHTGLTQMTFVDSMHQRKQLISELSDAFIAMPGGFGTLEELAEILTWSQLGLIKKPIGILNVNSFFDPLLSQLDAMVDAGFLKQENRYLLIDQSSPIELLDALKMFEPAYIPKWLNKEQT